MEDPLRLSLFKRVPPYINFVPAFVSHERLVYGPQYWDQTSWDQDHFWKIPMAMGEWISQWAQDESAGVVDWVVGGPQIGSNKDRRGMKMAEKSEAKTRKTPNRSKRRSIISSSLDPFAERSDNAINFMEYHPERKGENSLSDLQRCLFIGVKLVMFPKMHQITRKDQLGENFGRMQKKFPDDFDFHPITLTLPRERPELQKLMALWSTSLWILKPPNNNNGRGVQVVHTFEQIPEEMLSERAGNTCVQKYIPRPFLINGCKFDLRIYALLTSLDPLVLYIYDDGLVRIATEKYTENVRSIRNSCIHVTNYDINRKNANKFIVNDQPHLCQGHKWRLKPFWTYLHSQGVQAHDIDAIWSQVEDVIIKSILVAHKDMVKDFRKITKSSSYNCYKLLGFDLLLDADLKVHVIEANARPALLGDLLDKAVNRPMVAELMRIVGYHIPASMRHHQFLMRRRLQLITEADMGPPLLTFERKMYSKHLTDEEEGKQERFTDSKKIKWYHKQDEGILDNLLSCDVRTLIKLEEELSQGSHFQRIFPRHEEGKESTEKYFRYMEDVTYYDQLVNSWEKRYAANRAEGIQKLQALCDQDLHLT